MHTPSVHWYYYYNSSHQDRGRGHGKPIEESISRRQAESMGQQNHAKSSKMSGRSIRESQQNKGMEGA